MSWNRRTIFHVDVNSAFLSWEAVKRLQTGDTIDLRKIPCVVGGDERSRHGIVLAKSDAAKRCDIHTGEVLWQARQKCPNLIVVPPDHALYDACSERLMALLSDFTPVLERYSVDECFLDMTHYDGRKSPEELAHLMRRRVHEELGFTVNVGISTNKLLAKMASEREKPNRVHTLWPEEIPEKLWSLPVRELFMVGPRTVPRLYRLNIFSVSHLAHADPQMLMLHFKSFGRMMWQYANGLDDSPVEVNAAVAKAIGNSTTTPLDLHTVEEAKTVLLRLTESAAVRLRDANLLAQVVSVSLRNLQLQFRSHQRRLVVPTDHTGTLYLEAVRLLNELWDGEPVRHVGISFSALTDDTFVQATLFDGQVPEKKRTLDQKMDELRSIHGAGILTRGSLLKRPPPVSDPSFRPSNSTDNDDQTS